MNDIVVFLVGVAITAFISLGIVIYIKPYLKKIMLELNGERERPANFWVAYTAIILLLVPLIFAIWIVPEEGVKNVFFQISRQLKWGLMGLVGALAVIGVVIIRFVPKSDFDKIDKGTKEKS